MQQVTEQIEVRKQYLVMSCTLSERQSMTSRQSTENNPYIRTYVGLSR